MVDLYHLTADQPVTMDRNGQEICRELSKSHRDSKSSWFRPRIIWSLGIRLIGSKAAATIANVVQSYGTVWRLITKEELVRWKRLVPQWPIAS